MQKTRKCANCGILERIFGTSPKTRILSLLLENVYFDLSKNEIIKELGMSRNTLFSNWNALEEAGIVKVRRKVGKTNLYVLDLENQIVKNIMGIVKCLSLNIKKETRKCANCGDPLS